MADKEVGRGKGTKGVAGGSRGCRDFGRTGQQGKKKETERERNGTERNGKERNGKERKGKERKGKEWKGKEKKKTWK